MIYELLYSSHASPDLTAKDIFKMSQENNKFIQLLVRKFVLRLPLLDVAFLSAQFKK